MSGIKTSWSKSFIIGTLFLLIFASLTPFTAKALAEPPELPDDFVLKNCEAIDTKGTTLDKICECSDSLAFRNRMSNLVIEAEKLKDELGCENITSHDDICGGFLDSEQTYIEINAPSLPLTLDPEELVQLTATIVGKGSCDDPNADIQLQGGSISWWSDNIDIATVSQSGLVTAVKPGSAFIHTIVDEYPFLQGGIGITVRGEEDPLVNIAFVVYNGAHNFNTFPPYGWDNYSGYTSDWYGAIAASFGLKFDLSLVNYNKSICSDITSCGYASGPCDQSRTVLPFFSAAGPGDILKSKWQSAWESLETVCDSDPWDLGSSLYSALINTINNSHWDPNADAKAIFVFPAASTCYYLYEGACTNEAFTGRTLNDVVFAANEKGINLYVINVFASLPRSSDLTLDGCDGYSCTNNYLYCYQWAAAKDEYHALAQGTNGDYYAVRCDYPHYTDAVKQAILDVYQRAKSPN